MNKTIHVTVLVPIVIFFGCHDTVELTRENVEIRKPPGDITVWTRNGLVYQFAESRYWVVDDSIKGRGTVENGIQTGPFEGSVALADVYDIKAEQFNSWRSVLLGIGVAAASAGVVAVLVVATRLGNTHILPSP